MRAIVSSLPSAEEIKLIMSDGDEEEGSKAEQGNIAPIMQSETSSGLEELSYPPTSSNDVIHEGGTNASSKTTPHEDSSQRILFPCTPFKPSETVSQPLSPAHHGVVAGSATSSQFFTPAALPGGMTPLSADISLRAVGAAAPGIVMTEMRHHHHQGMQERAAAVSQRSVAEAVAAAALASDAATLLQGGGHSGHVAGIRRMTPPSAGAQALAASEAANGHIELLAELRTGRMRRQRRDLVTASMDVASVRMPHWNRGRLIGMQHATPTGGEERPLGLDASPEIRPNDSPVVAVSSTPSPGLLETPADTQLSVGALSSATAMPLGGPLCLAQPPIVVSGAPPPPPPPGVPPPPRAPPPPPPPPPPGFVKVTPTQEQRRRLKALHWDKIQGIGQESVWAKLQVWIGIRIQTGEWTRFVPLDGRRKNLS